MIKKPTQPQFIDCQRELLAGITDYDRQIARLKAQRLAWIIAAVGGWGVVGILIWIRANT